MARLVLSGSAVTPLKRETPELQAAVHTLEDPVPAEFAREFQASTVHVPLPEAFFVGIDTEPRGHRGRRILLPEAGRGRSDEL